MKSEINFDQFDNKSSGKRRYEHQLKNKGRTNGDGKWNRYLGKIPTKRFNDEIAHHIVIDHHKIDGIRLHRGTSIQTFEPYDNSPHPNRNQSTKIKKNYARTNRQYKKNDIKSNNSIEDFELQKILDGFDLEYLTREKLFSRIINVNSHTNNRVQITKPQSDHPKPDNIIRPERIVKLDILGQNIFLGDSSALKNVSLLKKYDIGIIINFGETDHDCDYNINFPDSVSISYYDFNGILEQTEDIIAMNSDKKILLMCDQGVNRSVSIAMGLMIKGFSCGNQSESEIISFPDGRSCTVSELPQTSSQSMTLDEAIDFSKNIRVITNSMPIMEFTEALDHMENLKIKIDPNWNNLTNFHLRNLLRVVADRVHLSNVSKRCRRENYLIRQITGYRLGPE